MIDHLGLTVSDYARSRAFYEATLKPLGYRIEMEFNGEVAGFGVDGKPDFWIAKANGTQVVHTGLHVAFQAANRAQIREFHGAALEAGGQDNGAPGIRADYHPNYYGAFAYDPDGNNVEAVCHRPE